MKVYHGTSFSHWEKIKKIGLIPRGQKTRSQRKRSNWTHSIESNPDTIYFSNAYAMYFALSALNTGNLKKDHAVIIELDTDLLDPTHLVPDEDVLEQVSRYQKGGDSLPKHWDMKERTRYYRELTLEYAKAGLGFEWSIQNMGTAGYIGTIMPDVFTRVAIIDISKQAELAWTFMDAQVSIMNYRFVGSKYKVLNKKIFGDVISQEDVSDMHPLLIPESSIVASEGIQIVQLRAVENTI